MKNYEIMEITGAYRQTSGEFKLPASVAWKRRLNMKKLLDAEMLIREAVQEIQKDYSDDVHSTDLGDGKRQVKGEYLAGYNKKINELYEQDTPIEIQKVGIGELGTAEISDKEMDTLAFMIE